jgi:hypothetical protein
MPLFETAATAVVHTLGIMALSYSLSPDGHLQAIVPRIEPERTKHKIKATADIQKTKVESHAALLAFRASDRIGGNWKPAKHPAAKGYLYVELDGEQIHLIDGLPTPTVKQQPASIPGLPGLQTCCPDATLRAEFQPPKFSGAAAVVNFPLGNSKTETCGATVAGTKSTELRRRIDTRIAVDNNGKLIVRSGSKEIILKGSAELYLANIPRWALVNQKGHTGGGVAHFQVYYAMVQFSPSCDFNKCYPAASATCDTVMRQPARLIGNAANEGPPLWGDSTAHIDYQCSNSQWP